MSAAQPLISVTLPNYNYGSYLKQAIESVLMQTYENFEILLTDDGSTDESVKIICHYAQQDKRIKAAFFKENQGNQAAHADTWKRVTGDIIYQFSSDDYICNPDFFALGVAALAENPTAAGFFGIADVIIAETGLKMTHMGQAEPIGYVSPEQFIEGFLTRGFFVPGISSLWHKSEIIAVGGYDSRLGPQSDYFINHALPARSGVVFSPKVFAHARASLAKTSYSSSASPEDETKRKALFMTKMRRVIPNGEKRDAEWNRWLDYEMKLIIEKYENTALQSTTSPKVSHFKKLINKLRLLFK
jgi:glycosyltransferase involved in cell wall biosynthesis